MCLRWADRYTYFGRLADNPDYIHAFTYLNYDPRMRSMIYTTNWIERLNRDFRRVLRMRASMPGEHSVITLIGKVAMDKKAYRRIVPKLDYDQTLFGTDADESDTDWNQ
jgi:transposase-like protein